MKQISKKPIAVAMGVALTGGLMTAGIANAAQNPFGLTELGGGYMQVADNHMEGKCGGNMAAPKAEEGKCGGSMAAPKAEEGKCGGSMAAPKAEEGKCGGSMAAPKAEEGKCGEGKCGGSKGK